VVSILVDNRDEQMLNQNMMPARQQLGYMQTQVDIITSQRTAQSGRGAAPCRRRRHARRRG
jgi:hypothetical protein